MIIDMHYHIDERMEAMDRLLSQMDRHGIDRIVLIAPMVDPFHVEGTAAKLASLARKMLTGRGYRLGLMMYESTVTKNGRFSVLGDKYDIYSAPDNSLVEKAMVDHPDRFWGWFFINPSVEDSIFRLESEMTADGWIGVKCHPFWHRYAVRYLDDAAAWCAEKNLPLLIHLGGKKENGDFRYLPERHPKLKIIYAHAGLPHYKRLWDYIKDRDNLYVDLSSPYLNKPLRLNALHALGPEKCMYGTDGPFGYPAEDGKYDHGAILSEIRQFPISFADQEKILEKNFMAAAGL
ncbi:MAG: amidohydrolase family protein [Desulfobacterales bacterium]